MELRIQQMMGLEDKEIELKPGVNYIFGSNSAGKSSIVNILRALTVQEPDPQSLGKRKSKHYWKNKAAQAQLGNLVWTESGFHMEDPDSDEKNAFASRAASGLINFTEPTSRETAKKLFSDIFYIKSNDEDLINNCEDISDEEKKRLIVYLQGHKGNWDAACTEAQESAKMFKRDWKKITGLDYSRKDAGNWQPEGLEESNKEKLLGKLAAKKEGFEKASFDIKSNNERYLEIAEKKKLLPKLAEKTALLQSAVDSAGDEQKKNSESLDKCKENGTAIRNQLEECEKSIAHIQEDKSLECPACDQKLHFNGQSLEIYKRDTEALPGLVAQREELNGQLKALKAEYSLLSEACNKANGELREAERNLAVSKHEYAEAKSLVKDGEGLEYIDESNALSTGERDSIEVEYLTLTKQFELLEQCEQAGEIHKNVCNSTDMAKLLGHSGIRFTKASRGIQQITNKMVSVNKITDSFGWKPLVFHNDELCFYSGGLPIEICAENEKLKAQASMQLTLGLIDWSKSKRQAFVLIDGVDKMQGDSWKGFEKLIDSFVRATTNAEDREQLCVVIAGTSENQDHISNKSWNCIEVN